MLTEAIGADIVVIGGSAGSLSVLLQILPDLQGSFSFPILTVLHRKAYPDSNMTELFRHYTQQEVFEVEDKTTLVKGAIYIAPPDYHVLFEDRETLSLDFSERINYSRPAIDVAFDSASEVFEERTTGILLSGANGDGAEGLRRIKERNGTAIIQDPDTAEVDYMPRYAMTKVAADYILPPLRIAAHINNIANKPSREQ